MFLGQIVVFVSRLSLLSWYRKVAFCAVRCVQAPITLANFVGNLMYLRILGCIDADRGVKCFPALFQEERHYVQLVRTTVWQLCACRFLGPGWLRRCLPR